MFLFRLRLMREPREPRVEVKRDVSGEMRVAYVELRAGAVFSGASSSRRSYSSYNVPRSSTACTQEEAGTVNAPLQR